MNENEPIPATPPETPAAATLIAPRKISISQHAQAIAGVFLLAFANSYLTSPSVVSYLHGHAWAGDLVTAGLQAYHVARTYKL